MAYEHGRILEVRLVKFGSELTAATVSGVTSLTVEDAADFDEGGGSLVINNQAIVYTACDDETGVLTLASALAAAADEGDRVELYDPLYQVTTQEKVAQVKVDGDDDDADPVEALIAHYLVDKLDEGIRGLTGESVLLELDGDEWRVIDVLGQADLAGSAIRAWDLDTFTVTVTGDQSPILTYEPLDGSLHMGWNGLWQPHNEFTCVGRTVTIPDTDALMKVGDIIDFRYLYMPGQTRAAESIPDEVWLLQPTGLPTLQPAVPPISPGPSNTGSGNIWIDGNGATYTTLRSGPGQPGNDAGVIQLPSTTAVGLNSDGVTVWCNLDWEVATPGALDGLQVRILGIYTGAADPYYMTTYYQGPEGAVRFALAEVTGGALDEFLDRLYNGLQLHLFFHPVSNAFTSSNPDVIVIRNAYIEITREGA